MKKFVAKLRKVLKPYDYYAIRQEQREEELIELGREVQRMGFTKLSFVPEAFSNPGKYLSTAIEVANYYGIVLGIGLSRHGCRALLPKEKWQRELNLTVPSSEYGTLYEDTTVEKKENMEYIIGIGNNVREAICKCLIYARNAGVL